MDLGYKIYENSHDSGVVYDAGASSGYSPLALTNLD